MSTESTRRVTFTPKAGFVVKTTSVADGIYKTLFGGSSPTNSSHLEPTSSGTAINVTKGYKIFLNVCYDPAVPPPPERSEDQIRKAMLGADLDSLNDPSSGPYYVPVIVSDGKPVTDKAGKSSLAFDCVFNASLKSRVTKDADFRTFLTELALERVEDKSGLSLSREISSPNILSKGTLEQRTVLIPSILPTASSSKPIIEEITSHTIPKSGPSSDTGTPSKMRRSRVEQPVWSAEIESTRVSVTIQVPKMTKPLLSSHTTLDVEAHRILLRVQQMYELDLRLSPSGKLSAVSGKMDEDSPTTPSTAKGLDPDTAKAAWNIKDDALNLVVLWKA